MFQRNNSTSPKQQQQDTDNMSTRLNMMQVEPLDEQEQQHVIDDLKQQALKQVEFNRQMFSLVFNCVAVIFVLCAVQTIYYPWTIQHQKHFQELLPTWAFLLYYGGSAFCFFVAGMVAKVSS